MTPHTPREFDDLFTAIVANWPQEQEQQEQGAQEQEQNPPRAADQRRIRSLTDQLEEARQDIDQLRRELEGMQALDEQLDQALKEIGRLRARRRTRKPARTAEGGE